IIIRHSIPVRSPPRNDESPKSGKSGISEGKSYLLRSGRNHPALRGAFGCMAQETIFQDPCLQPLIDHPSNDTIRDSSVKKGAQVGVRNRIEVFFDVEIDHPTQSVAHKASTQIL